MRKNIFIILPFKESLNPNIAGAVSIYVQDATKYSKLKKNIKIISSEKLNSKRFFRNKNYIKNFCDKYKNNKIDIIEIHNRPEYLRYIKNAFPKTRIALVFHNDPQSLRGSQTYKEREFIIDNCDKVIFISRWIQQRFFSSFKNANLDRTALIYHGIKKDKNISLSKKRKNILFVGKLNHSKGYHIFVKAAEMFKKYDNNWNFIAIGNEARKVIFPDPKIVKEIGYKKNSEVLKFYKNSEISVGNSVWNEPLGRIAIESSSRKCLPIISNIAGLNESKKIAVVLKNNTPHELFKVLKFYTKNLSKRREKQNLFFKKNNFSILNISRKLDNIKKELLKINIKKESKKKNLKILHIANFNENSDGRLYYSFANKLNNGFIRNKHIVQTISDRNFLKGNRSLTQPFNPINKLNDKILNTIKNFSPDIVLLGHVFNIQNKIFDYCKFNNIKIASWYIDSISPEFLNGEKKQQFLNNLNNVDYCFITSSPEIFKNKNFYKKLKYIPNPVDSNIDNYKNFNKSNLEYDMFVAISHGQNRGTLKKGKSDERESLINFVCKSLHDRKIASFGLNGFEPVWGSNYYYYLSNSKIALNISRGSYQKHYSSDRISALIGNGLLVFIQNKTFLSNILSSNEVVYFNNKNDLVKKIKLYLNNDKLRKKIAKAGHYKYHKYMNNIVVSKYMTSSLGLSDKFKPIWVLQKN